MNVLDEGVLRDHTPPPSCAASFATRTGRACSSSASSPSSPSSESLIDSPAQRRDRRPPGRRRPRRRPRGYRRRRWPRRCLRSRHGDVDRCADLGEPLEPDGRIASAFDGVSQTGPTPSSQQRPSADRLRKIRRPSARAATLRSRARLPRRPAEVHTVCAERQRRVDVVVDDEGDPKACERPAHGRAR